METNEHLIQCLVYIDLNLVRAGVVRHPGEWNESGYKEILRPQPRYALIDHSCLMDLLRIPSVNVLQSSHQSWVDEDLIKEVDRVSKQLHTSRSAFTRKALRESLARYSLEQLERKHQQRYESYPVAPEEFSVWETEQAWGEE